MPIPRIREGQTLYKGLIAFDKAIGNSLIHQLAGPGQVTLKVRSLIKQVLDPFLVNPVSPFRREQTRGGKPDQEVPKRRRIEDTRVVDDDKTHISTPYPAPGPAP